MISNSERILLEAAVKALMALYDDSVADAINKGKFTGEHILHYKQRLDDSGKSLEQRKQEAFESLQQCFEMYEEDLAKELIAGELSK